MTLDEALSQTQATIATGSDSARLDAEILLSHVLGLTRTQLRMRGREQLCDADAKRLAGLSRRRRGAGPNASLTRSPQLCKLQFLVTRTGPVTRDGEPREEWGG